MSGHGGHKHRKVRLARKRSQRLRKARECLARVRGIAESKGQTWDPAGNSAQAVALNHDARRVVSASTFPRA
jgi:hypothetical protein